VRDSATAAITRFFYAWENHWFDTELRRFPTGTNDTSAEFGLIGFPDIHCHVTDWERDIPIINGVLLRSARSAFAVCPIWRYRTTGAADERVTIDAALDAPAQDSVRVDREKLLTIFDSLLPRAPTDTFLVAQFVRFLVDQRVWDHAYRASTTECRAERWWCAMLEGYVLARRFLLADADAAYRRAYALAPSSERCAWDDLRDLMVDAPRFDCSNSSARADTTWWLSDPLWSEPGNERYVEHMTRLVNIRLRMMLPRDERWSWRVRLGNDARIQMVTRYGWPTYVHRGSDQLDMAHDMYLLNHELPSPLNKPYTSYEYDRGRHQLIPPWSVVADPFNARAADWPWPFIERNEWPREHSALLAPLSGLDGGQVAMLARNDSIRVAVATTLPSDYIGQRDRGPVPALLLQSDGPSHVELLAAADGVLNGAVRFDAQLPSRPTMLGVEVAAQPESSSPAARSRFGVRPPPTLSTYAPGATSSSAPLVLFLPVGDAAPPTEPEAAIRALAPTLTIEPDRRSIGIYWETYGIAPTDTVEVAVWLRQARGGVVARVGSLLGLRPDPATPVAVSWVETPNSSGRTVVQAGPVPIIGRGIRLDVGTMTAGSYDVEVVVARPGTEGVRGRARVVVER
jgi:hypothetical protein